jgi:hypothetical protein
VIEGAVRTHKLLSDGRRQIGAFHLPGDIFGLENGDLHRFTAEAIVDTTVRLVERQSLEREPPPLELPASGGAVRPGSFASVWPDHGDFRSTPVNGHSQDRRACLKGANSGLMHRSNDMRGCNTIFNHLVGAREQPSWMSRPSALAVLRLITSSNLVGNSTGRSVTGMPFSIL